jgi:hypothetical protein
LFSVMVLQSTHSPLTGVLTELLFGLPALTVSAIAAKPTAAACRMLVFNDRVHTERGCKAATVFELLQVPLLQRVSLAPSSHPSFASDISQPILSLCPTGSVHPPCWPANAVPTRNVPVLLRQ